MADSFADLWTSSAPAKPAQKLGSAAAPIQPTQGRRQQQDVFAMLSAAGSSNPNSRSITPAASRMATPPMASRVSSSSPAGDAFSGLLGATIKSSNNLANLTIAERAAKAEQERKQQHQQFQSSTKVHTPSAWDGLDTLAGTSSGLIQPVRQQSVPLATNLPKVVQPEEDDWGLADFASQSSTAKAELSKRPTPVPPQKQSIWENEDFVSSRSTTPGDFDFGDREDGATEDESHEEDDVLGILSKPVDKITKPSVQSRSTSSRPELSKPASRPSSPPPHIIGQIVEMGFSPQQARIALAATDTGLDVQAALETLLSNGAAIEQTSFSEPSNPPPRRQRPSRVDQQMRNETPSPAQSLPGLGIQTDQIINQASEIGLNMFNRANAFWTSGKEKVQKAYVERVAASSASTGEDPRNTVRPGPSRNGSAVNGRPRWMQEQEQALEVRKDTDEGWGDDNTGFSDDLSLPRPPTRSGDLPTSAVPAVVDLFSPQPAAYVSPFRRGKAKAPPAASLPAPTAPRAPSPVALVTRNAISASSNDISVSAKYKAEGTAKYKLGQYAEAESAYTAAIDPLPSSHLLVVPLYNNRALTRIKTGDHAGAVDDCTTVISVIGSGYHPKRELKVTREDQGSSVDLADALVKSWKRRAEAWEGREKWEQAKSDWESIAGADWALSSTRNEAVKGIGRCRRMIDSASEAPSAPKAKPKSKPVARPSVKPTNSEALTNLRKATDAAEAEDQAKHDLKDTVDGRLNAWKGGKETNIRALLASLDTVLWPELGWQKVSMADVISPSQVKIRYTKAIAKLHPDKLNAGNTTLEHRMIANGIFGALNEAWNAFKH